MIALALSRGDAATYVDALFTVYVVLILNERVSRKLPGVGMRV